MTNETSVLDVIGPHDFPLGLKEEISAACKDARFYDLLAPFCLKTSLGVAFKYQLAAVPLPNNHFGFSVASATIGMAITCPKYQPGKYFVLKEMSVQEQVKADFLSSPCHGLEQNVL